MLILTPFKSVLDSAAVPSPGAATVEPGRIINPFDAIAIEEALRIRERGEADCVVGVTLGDDTVEEQARAALAMGVDEVMRVDPGDMGDPDPYAVAGVLAAVVKQHAPQLVFMGKQAVDDDCNQTGQMLAGLLGWPQATFVSTIAIDDAKRSAQCTRETDEGLETVAVQLPAVVTADLRLNEPRYVSLPGLIKARRKPITVVELNALAPDVKPRTVAGEIRPVPRRAAGMQVDSVDVLLEKLREEMKSH